MSYPIVGMPDWMFRPSQFPRSPIEGQLRQHLIDLAEATGGMAFAPDHITRELLEQILLTVSEHLRTEYVVAFQPGSTATPKPHHLEVRLRPGLSGVVQGGVRDVAY